MSTTQTAWVVIVLGGIATFAIRGSFLLVATRLAALPDTTRELLRMIPAAALAALVVPALLRTDGELVVLGPRPLAGLVALGIAWWTRSVFATIAVGLIAVVGFEVLLG
jgi:branched-subunit amino acid transport protein